MALSTQPCCPVKARTSVVCAVQKDHAFKNARNAVLAVGLSLTLTSAPMMVPPPVHANAYSDRVAVMEQRRKLLAETKEKALGEGETVDTTNDYLASMKSSLTMKIPEFVPEVEEVVKVEEVKAEEVKVEEVPRFRDSWVGRFGQKSAPVAVPEPAPTPAPVVAPIISKPEPVKIEVPAEAAPAVTAPWWQSLQSLAEPTPPPTPVPTPAPVEVKPVVIANKSAPAPVTPAPVKVEAKKVEEKKVEEPKQQQSKKRKGPLPMFLAQILMLGAYVGGVYVVLTKSKEMAQLAESIKQAVAGLKSAPSTGSAPSTESAPTTSE